MKATFVLFVVAVAVLALVNSSPLDIDNEGQLIRADRHKRLTCDLLSFKTPQLSINHSACAAHCLALMKGYKGGNCQNGVCHCRK
ncbi:hypothetical protein RN001_000638 [Aquatica leii]|uniref:Invertebrate defensins family profile domain-containing protein n=1 Tax=Aquatica leii TaxID=1421715 RepID=A0AAN7PF67_9COLE|nr:hypothetical protein RN001_000638 [Aquatica leii]